MSSDLAVSGWLHHARPLVCALQVASKLDAADKEKIEKEVDATIAWLDANQLAEVDELEHKLKELEGTCSPIITKMYQQACPLTPALHPLACFPLPWLVQQLLH